MSASHRRLLSGVSGLALASLGALASAPETAHAEEWLGTVSTDWYDPANWDTGVPTGALDVLVNNNSMPNPLVLGSGAVDLNGRSIAVSVTADGAMTLSGGASLTSGQLTVTRDPGTKGIVTVTGGSFWSTDATFIGFQGEAQLRIENGGVVTSNATMIARIGGTGTVTVDGADSRWEITDTESWFGAYGDATVTVSDGGVITNSGSVQLGRQDTGSGAVTVDGTGSSWEIGEDLTIGVEGIGSLNVRNGGVVTNSRRVHLGSLGSATGAATVEGAGSRWEIGENLIIGREGTGSMEVRNGGYVEADIVALGSRTAGNSASLILDGSGSELRAPGGIQIGFIDEPVMRITGGAKLVTGKVDPNPFIGRSYVGYLQPRGRSASVLISGAGSIWEDAKYIIMGNSSANATVTVEEGATFNGASIDVGRGRSIDASNPADPLSGHSRLLVSGADTTVNFDWLAVGNGGAKGTADISAGAVVTTGRTLLGGGATIQGSGGIVALSDVDLILSGAGTSWTATQASENSFVADTGAIRIRVTDGARLDVAGDMRLVGAYPDRVSTLLMNVEGAGEVIAGGDVLLGYEGTSIASATVDGTGSDWTVDGQFVVGAEGSGTLRAINGGRIAAGGVEIAREAGSAGTLVIGGATTAATAGIIDTATIAFGAGDGQLIFNHTDDIIFSAALSGDGEVRQQAGRTSLSGDSSSFSGTTYVNGGVLTVLNKLGGTAEVGDGSVITELAVIGTGNVDGTSINVANNAFATFHSGSSARSAAIVSTGTVNVHSGADLSGARLVANTGGEFTIRFDPFGAETHGFGSIEGAGAFRLAGTGSDDLVEVGSDNRSTTVSGAISEIFDAVSLRKIGSGALTLSGINTYTGATHVNGGILNVAGSLVSAVSVNAGGTLMGIGTIGGLTVNSGGKLAPGNSIGTMTVVGDASFGAGSTYEVEIAADGTSDLLAVDGAASLAGTLSVLGIAYPTGYPDAQDYTILTATNGVTGEFDTVTDNLPDVDVTAIYNANDVVIGYDKTTDTTSPKEIYPNSLQASLGAGRLFANTLQQRGQLHGLGGHTLGGVVPLGYGPVEGSHTADNFVTGLPRYGVATWASIVGLSQDVDANGGVTGYDAGTYGLASGIDSTFDLGGALGRAGVAFGYTNTDADTGLSTADIDAWHVGLYGGVENGPFALSGALSYAWQDYDFSRDVPFIGGGGVTAGGEADGSLFAASLEASYDLAARMGIRQDIGFRLAPTVSLDHVHGSRDGFTETGAGVLNMVVGEDDISRTWLGAGISMSARIVGESGVVFTPELQLMYEHNVGDDRAVTASQIVPAAALFTAPGVLEDDDFISVGAGLGIDFNERTTLKLRYDGSFGSNTQSHRGHVGLSVRF
ncbi:hypothetical protein ASD64_02605 [Mesorhizobium sp. Root157]|uniref:autotransporter domain-containing protein n=1 Tax=Mesorhizobium sp. Root157 TaxID=1736477 RepID=UPI0006FF119F|nr:autotransporter domain-containing protein [Mesorhizobium sp. Root157]KQZ93826.1 hypothetical protein ASD64_02605 [Mesorhizobium sp. Root157]